MFARNMYVAFDIETTGLIGTTNPWPEVTCAATRLVDGNTLDVRTWHSDYAAIMSHDTINELLAYLWECYLRNIVVVTFNGAGFDFNVLYGITKNPLAKQLASGHCDLMYQFAVAHGYFASLQSFCDGIGIEGKTGKAVDAIAMWETDKDEVLKYCENDVRALGDVYAHVLATGGAKRQTKRGTITFSSFELDDRGRLMTVAMAAERVVQNMVPDQSWMKDPPNLLNTVAWIWN